MVDTVRDIRTRFIGQNLMGTAARGARRDVRSIGDEYNSLRNKISTVNQLIAGVTLGIGGSSAIRTLSNLQNSTARLSTLTTTLAKDQQFLSSASRTLSIDIQTATDAFAKFKVLEDQGAVGAGETEQLILGLGNAYARFGAQAGQQENVIYGLAQALGQGQLQAQELNQVVEPLPGILNAIGRAAGMTGIEYRNLVKDGKITSEMFKKDLLGALKTFDGSAAALAGNIQQTLTRVSNSYKETLLDLNEPITAGVASIANSLTTALEAVGNNAELTASAINVVGAAILLAYGTRGLRAVDAFRAGIVSSGLTQIANMKAVESAYQRNAIETVAANARIVASNKAVALSTAQTTATGSNRAREAAATAAARKADALASADIAKSSALASLAEKERTVSIRASAAAQTAQLATLAKQQLLQTQSLTQYGATAQIRAAAVAQLAAAQTAAIRTEDRAVASANRLAVAQRAVESAERRKSAATTAATAAMTANRAATDKLALSNRSRFFATQAALVAQRELTITTANAAAATLAAANAANVLTGRLTLSALAARSAAASMAVLRGAYALIGGATGVALIAAYGVYKLYTNLNRQTEASETAKQRLAELGSEMASYDERVKAANQTLTLQEQLENQIAAGRKATQALAGQQDGGGSLREGSVRKILSLEELIANTRRKTQGETAQAQLAEISRLEYIAGLDAETAATNSVADKRAARAASERKSTLNDARELAEKYEGAAGKAQKIRDAIVQMQNALASAGSDTKLTAVLEQGVRGAQAELASILKTNDARKEQIKLAEDLRKKLASVTESYDTEAQKIARTFADKELTIRLNFETVDPETDKTLISQAVRDKLLVKNANAREAAITELMAEQQDKRTQEYESAAKERKQIDDKVYQDAVTRANELAGARNRAGDARGAADLLLNVERERLQRQFGLGETYRILEKDARIQSERTIQGELARIEDEAYQARLKSRNADSIDKGAGIFTKFADAAQTDVRSYITLLDNMTDAEKARATESNRIGKREFDRNKVYRKASALVDTFAGANRALAQGGIWGVGEAAAIVALGLRNVANINKQQYGSASSGGTGGSASSGSSSSTGTDGVDNSAATASSSNVFIVSMPGETADQTISRYNDFLPQLAQAARTRNVTISSDRLTVSDTALLRVG